MPVFLSSNLSVKKLTQSSVDCKELVKVIFSLDNSYPEGIF